MRTTIDTAGRIVVPKALREQLHLAPGQPIEIVARDGHLEIEVAATPMRLVADADDLRAVAEAPLPPLTSDIVRDTLEQLRR